MKGSYILLISISNKSMIKIGSLGKINFDKGYYAYIGSAMNNLENRVKRHLSKNKRLHWHIDYLLQNKNVRIVKVFYKESKRKEECKLAGFVAKHGAPVKKFGCSDCRCLSHLYKIKNYGFLNRFKFYK